MGSRGGHSCSRSNAANICLTELNQVNDGDGRGRIRVVAVKKYGACSLLGDDVRMRRPVVPVTVHIYIYVTPTESTRWGIGRCNTGMESKQIASKFVYR